LWERKEKTEYLKKKFDGILSVKFHYFQKIMISHLTHINYQGYLNWESIFPIHRPSKTFIALKKMLESQKCLDRESYDDKIQHRSIKKPYNNQVDYHDYFEGLGGSPNKSLTSFQQQVSKF
jgi:hypothetical protein